MASFRGSHAYCENRCHAHPSPPLRRSVTRLFQLDTRLTNHVSVQVLEDRQCPSARRLMRLLIYQSRQLTHRQGSPPKRRLQDSATHSLPTVVHFISSIPVRVCRPIRTDLEYHILGPSPDSNGPAFAFVTTVEMFLEPDYPFAESGKAIGERILHADM